MRPKTQSLLNLRLLLICIFIAFFILFVMKSSIVSSPPTTTTQSSSSSSQSSSKSQTFLPRKEAKRSTKNCNKKIPASVAKAVIHYSTSAITPQQTTKEISVTSRILEQKSPANFLVFGLGHDSLMWHTLNYGGRTVFLEEDQAWIHQITKKFPMLESYHVTYHTKLSQASDLLETGKGPECTATTDDPRYSMCQLALKSLPSLVYEVPWDLIMVDAPTGYHDEAPGRMAAIYTAGMMARHRGDGGETDVFVHDVNRVVEDKFSKVFLCEGYMKRQEGRLRHFTIPSYRNRLDMPFCP